MLQSFSLSDVFIEKVVFHGTLFRSISPKPELYNLFTTDSQCCQKVGFYRTLRCVGHTPETLYIETKANCFPIDDVITHS